MILYALVIAFGMNEFMIDHELTREDCMAEADVILDHVDVMLYCEPNGFGI